MCQHDPSQCPLCGGPNDCQLCSPAAHKGQCWCFSIEIPKALAHRVPAELQNRACICRGCVDAFDFEIGGSEHRTTPLIGFTLVELLATIAIIGVLASLLLPLLARSKLRAQGVSCRGSLRQLGIAAWMYWDDNNDQCFRYRGPVINDGVVYWFGWLQNGAEGERAFDASQGALYWYLRARGVEICPSLDYAMGRFKLKARGAAYGYGYNLHLSAPPDDPPIRISAVVCPPQTALFADTAQVNTFQAPASLSNPMLEEFYYFSTNASEATVHFRHVKKANAIYCDGHVAPELPESGSLDMRLPGEGVGRLPRGAVWIK